MERTKKLRRAWAIRLAMLAAISALVTTGAKWNAQRDVARMAAAADSFLAALSPEQRGAGFVRLRGRRAPPLALHPDRDVRAEGGDAPGNERDAA